jgi:hypothetical protein
VVASCWRSIQVDTVMLAGASALIRITITCAGWLANTSLV